MEPDFQKDYALHFRAQQFFVVSFFNKVTARTQVMSILIFIIERFSLCRNFIIQIKNLIFKIFVCFTILLCSTPAVYFKVSSKCPFEVTWCRKHLDFAQLRVRILPTVLPVVCLGAFSVLSFSVLVKNSPASQFLQCTILGSITECVPGVYSIVQNYTVRWMLLLFDRKFDL